MKKRIFIMLALVLVVATVLVGCQTPYSVSNPNNANDIVLSNGGGVVKHGDYVYFINGSTSYASKSGTNVYGNVLKGGIMRYKVSNGAMVDGSLELVVPKQVLDSSKTAGIAIYGDKLYYVTPAEIVDKSGNIQSAYIEFSEVKVDGSGNRVIYQLEGNDVSYAFGKTALMYLQNNTLYSVAYSNGKVTEVATDVKSAIFPTNFNYNPSATGINASACVYYTKNNADEKVYTYNEVYVTTLDGSYQAQIAGKATFTESDYTKMYTYTLLKNEAGKLYYTKSYTASSSVAVGSYVVDMNGYAFDETKSITWLKDNETKLSVETFSAVYPISGSRYIYSDGSVTKLLKADGSVEELFAKVITVIGEVDNVLYYDNGASVMYKYHLSGVDGPAEKLAVDTSTTTVTKWLGYELIDGEIYYINSFNAQNYMHRYTIYTDTDIMIGKKNDVDKAGDVDALIKALPTADAITLEDEDALVEAETAYEALTDEQKDMVTTYETLKGIREAFDELEED